MQENIKILISEDEILRRIKELAKQIDEDYIGKEIHLICVLKGAAFLTCELAKRITVPVTMDFVSASSYGPERESSGNVQIVHDLSHDIDGKNVIVVEDIIDTGITLDSLLKLFKQRNPASIELCTLLDKPEKRQKDINVKYVGFKVANEYVVGFGLDDNQKYRNLPYIGVIN